MAKQELSSLAVSAFCENMAMMMNAGIPMDEAADLLCTDANVGPFREAAESIRKPLMMGEPLSAAAEQSGMFPDYAVKMIAAGERAGRTESVLRALARYYAGQDRLQNKLKSAVVYPAVLLGIMAAILVVLLAAVLPVFTDVYQKLAGEIASSSFAYIRVAEVVGWVALIVTLVLVAALIVGAVFGRTRAGRERLAVLFEKFPFTARAMRAMAVAQFTRALSIFVASGLDVDTSLSAAGGMVSHRGVRESIHGCQIAMANGAGLATAIYDQKIFEPLYGRMLLSAARSGSIDETLAHLAEVFTEDADAQLDALLDAIEPALSGFLTMAVGITLLSVMLPLVGILGTVG